MPEEIIKAYIFNTELEVITKIAAIDVAEGFPDEYGNVTYCSYQFNNGKWIVRYSPNIGMAAVFGYEPSDFLYNYTDPNGE